MSDVIADVDMDDATRQNLDNWTGCVVGALTPAGYTDLLERAELTDIEIIDSHRVHAHASSATIRAHRPPSSLARLVVIDMILSSPRPSAVDPQITPLTQSS